jgi:hypothetical protein
MAEVPQWRVRGDWFDICKCNIPCPCPCPCPCTYAFAEVAERAVGARRRLAATKDLVRGRKCTGAAQLLVQDRGPTAREAAGRAPGTRVPNSTDGRRASHGARRREPMTDTVLPARRWRTPAVPPPRACDAVHDS